MALTDLFGRGQGQSFGFKDVFKDGSKGGSGDIFNNPPGPQMGSFSSGQNAKAPYTPPPTPAPTPSASPTSNAPVNLNNPNIQQGPGGVTPMPFNAQQLQEILARANPMLLRYLMMLNRGRF